ncbi:hypothetical protein [Patulibacter minatonensis]|uniref:hypothetical protein n=1 Tax=Patulibacter minatonensis TaxID=298163 RepID=UPI00047E1013|nr:hypothetical protein [Patulibacter minatonensis]
MARRAAPVLAVLGALAALLLLAPAFPELQPPQRAALVAAVPPMALLGALTYLLAPLTRIPAALAGLAGVGLVATAATAAVDAHGGGTLPEALLAIALGLLFARVFDLGAFVIGLPLVIGAVDLFTTLSGDAVKTWPMPVSGGDPLVLELPSWSAQTGAAEISVATVLFLAALQGYAVRERLRPAGTAVGMTVGLILAYLLEWRTERAMPFTAFVAGGFLVASSDRLPTWLRAGGIERG